jgi:hypothetical protein
MSVISGWEAKIIPLKYTPDFTEDIKNNGFLSKGTRKILPHRMRAPSLLNAAFYYTIFFGSMDDVFK